MTKVFSVVSLAMISMTLGAQSTTTSQQQSPVNAAPANAQVEQLQAVNVSAELTKGLDAKRAKAGDEVDAKTTSDTTLADGTTLPKGTKLMGNVVEVTAKSKEEKDSKMVISLNRAVLKDGKEVAIRSAVTSMTAPATAADTMAMPSGGSEPASAGGSSGSTAPSAPSMSPMDTQAPQQGQVLKSATDSVAVGNKPHVMLSAPKDTNSAGVLEAKGENISLESGTKFTLSVIPAKG